MEDKPAIIVVVMLPTGPVETWAAVECRHIPVPVLQADGRFGQDTYQWDGVERDHYDRRVYRC